MFCVSEKLSYLCTRKTIVLHYLTRKSKQKK
nr:MAG TPA: hypothetical protein [Bacteriophage sp.]